MRPEWELERGTAGSIDKAHRPVCKGELRVYGVDYFCCQPRSVRNQVPFGAWSKSCLA